jgi:protein phosphatase
MQITLPELSLVVLIGPSGAGKSTFARNHFRATEILSSDVCRGLVSDDENDQAATGDAFDVLHFITRKRLAAGRLTVVDATNVQSEARKALLSIAREFHVLPVAIVFDLPERICQERNRLRPDRNFGPHVIRRQLNEMHRSLRGLQREGFRYVFTLSSPQAVDAATIVRQRLWNNKRDEHGPFDIIGDIHGCYEELVKLLGRLGYQAPAQTERPGDEEMGRRGDEEADSSPRLPVSSPMWAHPAGRKAIFLGDLVDRGPASPAVLRLVMAMVAAGTALCVPGNHDVKLLRKLRGREVRISHGLAETLAQLDAEPPQFRAQVADFIDSLVSHYVLDDGRLVVAHAGMKQAMQGRGSSAVREFALYGETTGETDEFGLPVRYNWAAEYRGAATVVYGHTPVPEPEWLNNTINIDTGCVFGGKLTALRYPERELLSVAAAHTYAQPARPFLATEQGLGLSAQQRHDELLDIADVLGKRIINTGLQRQVTIREENAIAALEVMSRFAVDPRWLIYLPPTMSPSETSQRPGLLEHPDEAFAYYRSNGVDRVICEEKHMGSRAVVVLCRDHTAAQKHFGDLSRSGVIYTRTGRPFFDDEALAAQLLERINTAAERAGLWEELRSSWMLLDCELMPWSAKAQSLLRQQYAPVGAAAALSMREAVAALEATSVRVPEATTLQERYAARASMVADYRMAYARYCWPVNGLHDLRLAPFHLLASEGAVHLGKDHRWHMETLARLSAAEPTEAPLLISTATREVDLTDAESVAAGVAWWETLTGRGGEGMVVKPLDFIVRGPRGLLQPAIKCRGPEYLRIIYGPEYDAPDHLARLRSRGLAGKRSLALREFALGVEGLQRFARREPLRSIHECVFGVLALESEPVDPRL